MISTFTHCTYNMRMESFFNLLLGSIASHAWVRFSLRASLSCVGTLQS